MTNSFTERRAACVGLLAGLALGVGVLPALAHQSRVGPYTIYNAPPFCGQGENILDHGESGKGTFSARVMAVTDMSFPWVGNVSCVKPEELPGGDMGARLQIMKQTPTGGQALCEDTGWGYTEAPTSAAEMYLQTPSDWDGPCGDGYYKAVGWQKVYWNGAWRPATPKGYATDKWHFFPFEVVQCYIDPTICFSPY